MDPPVRLPDRPPWPASAGPASMSATAIANTSMVAPLLKPKRMPMTVPSILHDLEPRLIISFHYSQHIMLFSKVSFKKIVREL